MNTYEARHLPSAALALIASGDGDDDGGSDEFHLVCGIEHRFATRDDAIHDPLVQMGLALTIGMLGNRTDHHALVTRICLEKLAESVGLTSARLLAIAAQAAAEGVDVARLSKVLLDDPSVHPPDRWHNSRASHA
jgi:hypothetical protein